MRRINQALWRMAAAMYPVVVDPPPEVVPITYGASADAGQVNETDTLAVGANRYWVNSSTGNNSNTGLVQASPIQYLDKVDDYTSNNSSSLPYNVTAPSGSHFLLARGTIYDGFLLASTFPTIAPYTSYGDFKFGASGVGARPKILFKNSPALFNSVNSGLYANRVGTKVENVDLDMQYSLTAVATVVTGTFVDGDVVTATGGTTSGAVGIFHYDQAGTYTIQLTSFPTTFANGDVITAAGGKQATINSIAYCTGIACSQADQSVKNGSVTNALGIGILLTNISGTLFADNAVIQGMTIGNACLTQTNGAGIDGGGSNTRPVENLTITHNTIFDCGTANSIRNHNMYLNDVNNSYIAYNWSYMTQNRGSFGLVMHGNCSNNVIEYNLFEYCGNGVGINDGYLLPESFTNITFRNNISRFHGQRPGQTQGLAAYFFSLVNSNFYNNIHYGSKLGYTFAAIGPSGGGDAPASGNVFSHETLYNIPDGLAITGTMGATNSVFQNMIIMSTANTGNLLTVNALAYPKTTVRNLLLWMPNNSGNCISWNGTNYTLDAWLAGPNTSLGLGCIKADPQFVNAATGDFRLQAGSPAKLAGYNSGISTDFAGAARHATTPSIGAYE